MQHESSLASPPGVMVEGNRALARWGLNKAQQPRQRAPRGMTCLPCKMSKIRCDLNRPCTR
jgi:hypothetical protein